jgi:hypothetical protein
MSDPKPPADAPEKAPAEEIVNPAPGNDTIEGGQAPGFVEIEDATGHGQHAA